MSSKTRKNKNEKLSSSDDSETMTSQTKSNVKAPVVGTSLKKGFTTWKLLILGLAFMAPGLSLLATFPLVLTAGWTWMGIPLAYLIAGVAAIITAVGFGQLVKAFPESGGIWTFSSRQSGFKFGQLAVWIYFLEILVVPTAALIPVGFYLESWLGVPPWVTIIVFVSVVALLAIGGTELSVRSMAALFLIQVGILVAFAISSVIWSINTGNFSSMATLSFVPDASLFGIAGITAGATLAIFSFLGYEAPAAVTSEAEKPKTSVPWAIVGSALIITALYVFLAWAFVLAIPSKGLHTLLWYVNPVPALGDAIWGLGLGNILNFAGVLSGLVAALAGVTAGSRILQKLGEDKIMPEKIGKLDVKTATPIVAISFIAIITLILGNFTPWEVIAYTIAAGALPAFIIINFLSFWHYRKSLLKPKVFALSGILPWAGIFLCGWFIVIGIPDHLKWILLIWICIGILLVFVNSAIRPKIFRRDKKEKISLGTSIGLVISVILLITVILAFNYWLNLYSTGIEWWRIIAPYAISDVTAIIATIGMAVVFLAIIGFALKRKKIGGEE